MIEAYMDESGMHGDAHVVAVAAYASTHDEWSQFDAEWASILKSAGVDYFHAKDGRCAPLRGPLVGALEKRLVQGWVVSARSADYKAHAQHEFRSTLGIRTPSPQSDALKRCANGQRVTRLGPVSFVIEHGQPNVSFVKAAIESLMSRDGSVIARSASSRALACA